MKMNPQLGFGLLAGIGLTALVMQLLPTSSDGNRSADAGRGEPLYWVAPMDPNYRRDTPGKSPMGMDLIAVYSDTGNTEVGSIRIDPDVVNNLGVRTAVAQLMPWQSEIRTVGYVGFDQDRLLHIHPRVEGWVETLHVTAAGDPVSAGQALYELYSPELVNAQEAYLLALQRDNPRLVEASYDRLRALQLSKEFIATLKQTRQVVQTVTFRSSQNGVVDDLAIREGFYVKPGTTMLSIGVLDEVWVEAEVFERQAGSVHAGQPVTISTEFQPGKRWQGTVDYVYPTLDPKTRTLRVRMRFANEDELLKPNMFAEVVIHSTDAREVLTVPREAVIRTGSQNRVVLALGAGRFKSISVEVGRIGERVVEILAGLEAGDEIVSSAQFLLDSESSKTSDFKRMHHGPAGDAGDAGENMSHEGMNHD